MEALLDSIRVAMREGASDDERRRGVSACYAVADLLAGPLAAAAPAQPLAALAEVGTAQIVPATELALVPAAHPLLPLAGPLASNPFAGMTADQILELAVAKLRGAVGDDAAPPPAGQPFRLTLVPVPRFP